MTVVARIIGIRSLCGLFCIALASAFLVANPLRAQVPSEYQPIPPKVQQVLELLDDPAVRQWISQRAQAEKAYVPMAPATLGTSPADYVEGRLTAIESHVAAIIHAIPRLPADLEIAADAMYGELKDHGIAKIALLILIFITLGFGAERIFQLLTSKARAAIRDSVVESAGHRLRIIASELALNVGSLIVFALGSLGAFLTVDWPPHLRQIGLTYLLAFLVLRVAQAILRLFLAAHSGLSRQIVERNRAIPVSDQAARFWHQRLQLLVGWFAFGWATVLTVHDLGVQAETRQVIAYAFGIGLVLIALDMVWRRPEVSSADTRPSRTALRLLATAGIVLMWASWVAGGFNAFWLLVVAFGLPLTMAVCKRAIRHLFRPANDNEADSSFASVAIVCVERAIRAFLIIGAIWLLIWAWGLELAELAGADTPLTRIVRGLLHALIILLVVDLAWSVLKAVLDRAHAAASKADAAGTNGMQRQARIRTLLPILRNIIFIVLLVMAALMALAALGVEIGPLVASAGVVGVAVGFGAQTLIRDIFSGVFYLLDDAFRVGEYIQSGSYKGTVESFSLRSIKLRHHRGALFTVPFGALGAIQNMSRDWVIDKMSINVAYGTDFDKMKKIIKTIGKELAEDPELGPDILEPLKMQGVQEFGDYGVKVGLKIMTKPGKQFVIRRRANALIQKLFDAGGIRFSMPIVQVSGGGEAATVAAQKATELTHRIEAKGVV